jgi:hypothetical protein
MPAFRACSSGFSRDITSTPAPDTGVKFAAKITKANCTQTPSGEIRTGHALDQTGILWPSRAYRGGIRFTLLEQVTLAQMTATGDCTPLGLAPVAGI